MENRSVGAELFHADGRTHMTKLAVAFRNFANAPKIYKKKKTCLFRNSFRSTQGRTKRQTSREATRSTKLQRSAKTSFE